ncbi:MAG: YdcF family protein [Bacteroidota bacterium]
MKKALRVIIVLGSPNDEQGNLSTIAQSRCDKAVEEFKKHPEYKIICTGGMGEHFNNTKKPHAEYTKAYLISKGIPDSAFLELVPSKFTIEDAIMAKAVQEKHKVQELLLVTSDFHMKRARMIFKRIFPNLKINYADTRVELPAEELLKLKKHEKNAIVRDEKYLDSLML